MKITTKVLTGSLASAAIALAGCGSSDGGGPPLEGTLWQDTTGEVTRGLRLQGGSYQLEACEPGGAAGSFWCSEETGVYAQASGDRYAFTPQHSTCPGPDPAYTVGLTLGNGTLTVEADGAVDVFGPDTQPAQAGTQVTLGCWEGSNQAFVPGGLQAVK